MSEKDRYLDMLKQLKLLISAGKDDDKADSLRDEMDIVWEMLYEDEQAEVRSVAAQIGDKKNEQ
jgi:hypothetical protein